MEIDKEDGHMDSHNITIAVGGHKGDPYIGVVVLYNLKIEESETIISLDRSLENASMMMDLVVYDNSLESDRESGSIFTYGCFRVHYFHDDTNPGVSKAYNFAASYANSLKKSWMLLLDQDTSFPVDAISTYILALKENSTVKLLAPLLRIADGRIISPSRYCCKRGFGLKQISLGLHSFKGISPVNSGMLINLEAFAVVGGYNEKVKLDFSDFQFIERFKKRFDLFCVVNVVATHAFSNEETSVEKLNERFGLYCDGARNCVHTSFLDWFQYMIVVFIRASSLVFRTKKLRFYKTMVDRFLR